MRSSLYGPWIGGIQAPGSTEPAGGWGWVSGEPFGYSNWRAGEPSNFQGIESVIHFYAGGEKGSTWNDNQPATQLRGYVVEYE